MVRVALNPRSDTEALNMKSTSLETLDSVTDKVIHGCMQIIASLEVVAL
jgi:hypothetical protein